MNQYFAQVKRWTPGAIRERGRELARLALKIWRQVGPTTATEHEKGVRLVPAKVRFRCVEQSTVNWKDAFFKLLTLFDASASGLLSRIAADKTMLAVIDDKGERFHRSKALIGTSHVNTHASGAQFQDWCRKIAEMGKIGPGEYEFIMPDAD